MALDESQATLHCGAKGQLYAAGMTFGRRLKRARERLELTQKDIGEALGISYQAVSQWELDKEVPEFGRIPGLRKILKVNYSWLLEGGDTPPPDKDAPEVIVEELEAAEQAAVKAGMGAMMATLRKQRRSA